MSSDLSPVPDSTNPSGDTLRRRLFSGGVWAFSAKLGTLILGISANALLTRLLSPAEFGSYLLLFSIVNWGASLGTLGLPQTATRFIAEALPNRFSNRIRKTVRFSLGLGLLGGLTIAVAYMVFGFRIGLIIFEAPVLATTTGLTAGWIIATALQRIIGESFRGFHNIRNASLFATTNLGLLTSAALVLTLTILLWGYGSATLRQVLLVTTLASWSTVAFGRWLLGKRVSKLQQVESLEKPHPQDKLQAKEILQVAWPILVSNATLFLLTQTDIWILSAVRPNEEVAIYGAALRLVNLVSLPLLIINAVVPPLIAELYAQNRKQLLEDLLRALTTVAGLPASIALIALIVFGAPILEIVYGGFYREGAMILVVLSLGQLSNVLSGPCGLLLIMTGHERRMMLISVLAGVITIAAAFAITRHFGAVGLSTVFATSVLVQNGLKLAYSKRLTGIWTHLTFSPSYLRQALSRFLGLGFSQGG